MSSRRIGAPMKSLAPGVIVGEGVIWGLSKSRKVHDCWECGRKIPVGTEAHRPVTNLGFRGRRICRQCGELAKPLHGRERSPR